MSLFDDLLADDLQRQQQAAANRIDLNRPLAPAEQDSMLTKIGGKALSGLAYAGKTIGTPGRIVRGALAGNPRELLNAVPFSDALGLTDESQSVSGTKLLEQYGMRDPDREKPEGFWGSVGDALPGFAAEVATDPLSYASFLGKALTPAGEIAKKIGAVPENLGGRIAGHATPEAAATAMGLPLAEAQAQAASVGHNLSDVVGKPLGALMNLRVPGFGPGISVGTGPTALKIGQKLSGAYDWLRASGPGQQLGRMFITKYDNMGGAEMQAVIRELDPQFRQQTAKGIGDVAEAGLPAAKIGADSAESGLARRAAEGWLDEGGTGPYSPEYLDKARQVGIRAAGQSAENMARYREIGADVLPLQSRYGTQHVYRGVTPVPDATGTGVGRGAQSLTTRTGEAIQREPIFDIPGGTDAANALSRNPAIAGISRTLPPPAARQEVRRLLGVDPAELAQLRQLSKGPISPEMLDRLGMLRDLNVKSRGLSRRLGQMPDEQLASGLFGNDLSTDVMKETLDSIKAQQRAEILQTLLSKHAQVGPIPPRGAPAPAGLVPAADILKKIGLSGGIPGASPERLKELQGFVGPLSPSDAAALAANQSASQAGFRQANANLLARLGGRAGNIGQVFLPEKIAEQALQLAPRSVTPGYLDPILNKIDSFTTAFKALNTMPFPGNAVRNATTDYVNNVLAGLSPASAARGVGDILKLRGGPDVALKGLAQEVPAIAARLPLGPTAPKIGVNQLDQLATQELGKMLYEHQLGGIGYNPARELAKQGGLAEMVPGAKAQQPIADILKSYVPTSKAEATPWNLAGVGSRTETTFAPVKAMREMNDVLADAERQGHFLERLRQGYTPPAAASEAHAAQLDYNLTDFEKRYLRRLFPFYCVPEDHEALTRTGWKGPAELKVGQEIMAYDHATGKMRWSKLRAVNVFDYDGELRELRRKHSSFRFTHNHRWPVVTRPNVVKGKLYGGKRKMVEAWELNSHTLIPTVGEFESDSPPLLGERLAAILGWVVTDGYHRWRGGHCEMIVYQSPSKFLAEIVSLLGTTPRRPHPDTGVVAVPVALEDQKEITEFFRSKRDMVEIVCQLNRAEADAMWTAMMDAEGSHAEAHDHFAQSRQVNPDVLGAFQILCLMTGRTANLSGSGCYVKRTDFINPCGAGTCPITSDEYKGKVWCPTVDEGAWVMRHDGAVILTGNSWTQANTPAQLGRLAEQPGGLSAQLVRLSNDLRQQQGFLPEYLGGGLAVPVGKEDETGTQRYLTRLDLPYEDALDQFSAGPKGLEKTLMGALANLNPLLKAPLEVASNRQFSSGRDLDELYSRTGVPLADQLVMNSPGARLLSTAGQLTDKRKDLGSLLLNLGTGVRLSDVDLNRQRDRAAGDRVQELLSGDQNIGRYEKLYVRPQQVANLSPQEIDLMRLYKAMEQRAAERARQPQGR